MNEDRAIKKVVKQSDAGHLPYGFSSTVMEKVFHEAEKKRRRAWYTGLGLVSGISLLMAAACVLVLRYYFDFQLGPVNFEKADGKLFGFFTYIGLLALVLLFFDWLLRKARQKSGV